MRVTERVKQAYHKLVMLFLIAEARINGHIDWVLERRAQRPEPSSRLERAQNDLVDTVLVIGIASVIGYVILQISSDTEDSADFTTGSSFDNASNEVTGGLETSFGLLDVVFIAFMLSLIIGALVGLRRR